MLVPRHRLNEVEELARTTAESFSAGDPFDGETRLGPLVSAAQRDRVRRLHREGRGRGCDPPGHRRRSRRPAGAEHGLLRPPDRSSPTVTRDMTVAREEIFGPRAGASCPTAARTRPWRSPTTPPYGLAAAVWAGRPASAPRPWRRRLRAGQVEINGGGVQRRAAPFGGFRPVGQRARARRAFGLEEFLEGQGPPVADRPTAGPAPAPVRSDNSRYPTTARRVGVGVGVGVGAR